MFDFWGTRCHDTCLESMGTALESPDEEHDKKPENGAHEGYFDIHS